MCKINTAWEKISKRLYGKNELNMSAVSPQKISDALKKVTKKLRSNMQTIIIINGKSDSEKNKFIRLCKQYYRTIKISTIDRIKFAATILGWDGVKDAKGMQYLSNLKDISQIYDHPKGYVMNYLDELPCDLKVIVVVDSEPEEMLWFKENINCYTVLIRKSGSEDYKNFNYDYIIENNGISDEFESEISNFLNNLMKLKEWNIELNNSLEKLYNSNSSNGSEIEVIR